MSARGAPGHEALAQILFRQGFGTRHECAGLVAAGRVSHQGRRLDDPAETLSTEGLVLQVDGHDWPFVAQAVILLHKPAGVECSRQPRHHAGVLSLLPAPLRRRGVQPVGRLDADTTGALLLTDDGALIHRLTSPRHHVPKVYEVSCARPVSQAQCERLREGVNLHDERGQATVAVRATDCAITGERSLRLTLTEGKYHQVKRMLAAVGNHVEALHRSAFGTLALGADLPPGHWRWLQPLELAALSGR